MADAMYQGLIAADVLGPPERAVDATLARAEIPVTAIDRLAGEYRVGRLKLDWPFKEVKEPFELPPPADEIERIAQAWFDGQLTWNAAMNQALDSYQRDGDLDESVRVAWNLSAAFPFEPDQAYLAGTLMLRAGDPERALSLLHRAARIQPRNTRYLMSLAQGFYQAGRTAESIQVLERVLALEPAHPRAPVFLERLQQESVARQLGQRRSSSAKPARARLSSGAISSARLYARRACWVRPLRAPASPNDSQVCRCSGLTAAA